MFDNFPKNLKYRDILPKLIDFLDEEEILLLYGMRQTGKTSLLYLLIQNLLEKKEIRKKQIIYLDLENVADFQRLEEIKDFNEFIYILKTKYNVNLRKKTYIFIDEIQYLSNASSFLKYLHDHYKPNLKFIVTGSSSLQLKKKFSDALTGRVVRFQIYPLSFLEFINFGGRRASATSFSEFVLYGGFPAVSLREKRATKTKLLKEIYSLYVRRDIKDLGAIEDIVSFNKLVRVLAAQNGGLVSEVSLSNSVDISRPTVKNYLFILQNTFVVDLLTPYYTNPKKELTKTPKLYFEDSGIRNAVLDNFTELEKRTDKGILVENVIYAELKKIDRGKINYWRTERKQEVDFIFTDKQAIVPLEIKYQSFKTPRVPVNLKAFIKKYNPQKAYIITRDFKKEYIWQKTAIHFIPCYSFKKGDLLERVRLDK
jgi:predicted AAA+ superfamily ATPase